MSTDPAKALKNLTAKLAKSHGAEPQDPSVDLCPEGIDGTVHELVYSFLLWEASHEQASKATAALLAHFIDYNELRISYTEEVVPVIGAKYPLAEERCERLRTALTQVFHQENGVTLASLREGAKRDGRAYLQALESTPGFVAARVAALSLGAHAFPVDARIAGVLVDAGVVEDGLGEDEIASRMERLLRAGECLPAYLLIESEAGKKGKPRAGSKARA